MKSSISIALLIFYITFSFRAVIPYVEYIIDYQYISEELCINLDDDLSSCAGSCYVNSQIKLLVGQDDSNRGIPLESRSEIKDILYMLCTTTKLSRSISAIDAEHNVIYTSIEYSVLLELLIPPPKQFT